MIESKDLNYNKYRNYLGKIVARYSLYIDQEDFELLWSDCIYNLCYELNKCQPTHVDAWAYNVIKSTYIGHVRNKTRIKRKPIDEYIQYNSEISIHDKIDLNKFLSMVDEQTYEWLMLVAKGYTGNEASVKIGCCKQYSAKLKNKALEAFKKYHA